VEGKALRIEGGTVIMAQERQFQCDGCSHLWEVPFGTGRPSSCPRCLGTSIHRTECRRPPFAGRHGRSQTNV
jgi:hypothetical protein